MGSRMKLWLWLTAALIWLAEVRGQPDYPSAHWNPPACVKYYTSGNGHQFCVIHDMEGYYQASVSYLNRCDKYGIPKDRNHIIGHNEWQNSTWTNWMAANYPAIDTTCNNHTDPGQYWDWNHFMTLITGAAAITRQPFSLLAETGTNVTFSVVAAGSNTLKYAWSKDGAPIAGATSSAYTISNVQPANACGYFVAVTNALGATTSRVATITIR